jgi:hypothetical protein
MSLFIRLWDGIGRVQTLGGDLIQELGLSISISQLTAQPGAGLCILITVVFDVPLFG